ncbi:MAG: ECF transporter S component [Promethearchaeota archaeon]|nr:MAG: ECF transporter S component [Candidatus Lokiarchaeota archaeon]
MSTENENELKTKNGYRELKENFKSIQAGEKYQNISNIKEDENHVHSVWLEKYSFRIALLSMFTAFSVVLAYILASIPNIEFFTLSIFLGGYIMGKKEGVVIGSLSALIFVFFNPWGVAPLPLISYQILHYALTGLAGALTHDFLKEKSYYHPKNDLYTLPLMGLFGFIGLLITISFDLITSLIGVVIAYGTLDAFVLYFLSGIVFTTVHEIGNTLGFIFILPGLIQLVYKMLH